MTSPTSRLLLAGLLAAGAVACGGGPKTDESPEAVPGMGGETQPTIGVTSETPEI